MQPLTKQAKRLLDEWSKSKDEIKRGCAEAVRKLFRRKNADRT